MKALTSERLHLWRLHPHRLVSLGEIMQQFHTSLFLRMAGMLAIIGHNFIGVDRLMGATRQEGASLFKDTVPILDEIGLSLSSISCRRVADFLESDKSDQAEFKGLITELRGRLADESSLRTFFVLDAVSAQRYEDPRKGWGEVISRLPDTTSVIEEANKCLALHRYAASVYHVLQVVEVGLMELGTFLGVTDPKSGWTAVCGKLEQIMKTDYLKRTPMEQEHSAFLEQINATAQVLKDAWRNKISHAHGRLVLMTADFSPEMAEEILTAARSFLRRLATGLPPVSP